MTEPRTQAGRDLPNRIVVGANGAYWRDFGTHYSMCPVSDDNDPMEVVAVYVREAEALPSVERLARALHATGLNSIGRKPGSHGKWTKQCICNLDAAAILAALRDEP